MSAALLLIKRSVVESRLHVCICEETEVIKNSSSFHFSSNSPDCKRSLMTPQLKHRCLCLFFTAFVSGVFHANDTFLIPPFNRTPLVQPEAAFVRRKAAVSCVAENPPASSPAATELSKVGLTAKYFTIHSHL